VDTESNKTLQDYLDESFLYHLYSSIKGIVMDEENYTMLNNKKELQLVSECFDVERLEDNPLNIFSIGLAVRKGLSSPALKYLACFGLACPTRPGYGHDFEELVALHMERLLGVQGYVTLQVNLQYNWPPISTSKQYNKEVFDRLDRILESQYANERQHLSQALKGRIPQNGRFGILFVQGTPRGQGGDILVLRWDGARATLEAIQCKNYKSRAIEQKWWASLGVNVAGVDSNSTNLDSDSSAETDSEAGSGHDNGGSSDRSPSNDGSTEVGVDIAHPAGQMNSAGYSY
jgi:hypothetical protein